MELFGAGRIMFITDLYQTTKWSKLKVFADDEVDIDKMMISHFYSVENTTGKGENAGYQHFLLFP